jgi:hypothetical protein
MLDLMASNQVQCKGAAILTPQAMVKGNHLAKGPFVPKGQDVMHMPTDASKMCEIHGSTLSIYIILYNIL